VPSLVKGTVQGVAGIVQKPFRSEPVKDFINLPASATAKQLGPQLSAAVIADGKVADGLCVKAAHTFSAELTTPWILSLRSSGEVAF
jgi:hypothetical protein